MFFSGGGLGGSERVHNVSSADTDEDKDERLKDSFRWLLTQGHNH